MINPWLTVRVPLDRIVRWFCDDCSSVTVSDCNHNLAIEPSTVLVYFLWRVFTLKWALIWPITLLIDDCHWQPFNCGTTNLGEISVQISTNYPSCAEEQEDSLLWGGGGRPKRIARARQDKEFARCTLEHLLLLLSSSSLNQFPKWSRLLMSLTSNENKENKTMICPQLTIHQLCKPP